MRWTIAAAVALAVSAPAYVAAQGFPGPPPGGGGPGGPRGFGPFGGQPSAVMAPLPALKSELKLSSDQAAQIGQIQQSFRQQQRGMFPRPGGPGGPGGPPPGGDPNGGPPPDFRAMFQKMQALQQQTDTKIKAVLTSNQRAELPEVLKFIQTARQSGIPPETLGDLRLTATQKAKLTAIGDAARQAMQQRFQNGPPQGDPQEMMDQIRQEREATRAQSMAVLTDSQRAIVASYVKAHPQRGPGFGGPGGPGGPPGGFGGPPPGGGFGPGGPPPPPDGPGGPPPGNGGA